MSLPAARLAALAVALSLPRPLAHPLAPEPDSAPAAPQAATSDSIRTVPFGVGERLVYDVKFGPIHVGTASMEILAVDTVRGRPAWHARFRVKGGNFLYRVDDTYQSWIDTSRLHSLRYVQDISEGRYKKERRYEFYPERQVYTENDKPGQRSVADPVDEASVLYFIRTVPLIVGETYEFDRYFKPEKNPVRIRVLRRDTVKVLAGTFPTIVIRPMIKNDKLFPENGKAEIWLADDSTRMMVQMKSSLSFGSLNLHLRSARPPARDSAGSEHPAPLAAREP